MDRYYRLSVFDLDKTLLRGNASMLFFRYLQRNLSFSLKMLLSSCSYFLRHRYLNLSLSELHYQVFYSYLHSRPKALFTDNMPGFLEELLPKTFYVPSILKLRMAQQMGHYTAILSNSPDFIVQPIAKYLGVHEWRGTEYTVDDEGRFEKIGFICHGKAKAELFRDLCHTLKIRRENTYAYSDSIDDFELLNIAGNPFAVNPDRKLKKISRRERWFML